MLFVITSFCSILSFILFLLGFIFAMQNTPVSLNLLALLFGILGFLGALGIKGKARVFYHEFKHKIVSGLVGNKPKRLEIKSDNEGEFEFEYTTETKKYNPFIAL
ncbi:MAG: hypothetical protein NZO16_02940, partial [Deltaproteobacteria bacterium]|nr:hypothetical protein [Deltaproteobacteria bacterium]